MSDDRDEHGKFDPPCPVHGAFYPCVMCEQCTYEAGRREQRFQDAAGHVASEFTSSMGLTGWGNHIPFAPYSCRAFDALLIVAGTDVQSEIAFEVPDD